MQSKLLSTIIIITLSLATLSCRYAKNKCEDVKTGKFKLTTVETGTSYITRSKTHQTEVNEQFNYEAKFDIVWLDGCTYELRNKQFISGPEIFRGVKGDVVTIEILDVNDNTYSVRTYIKSSDFVVEREIEIL
ncbi:hypothetical protein E1176_09475 [Fulvivirga sp. RKSG066]|nr:hypothetical protein [Fulvivirga aurantia]